MALAENNQRGGPEGNKMGSLIVLGSLIIVSIAFPPLAFIIVPFIIVSILMGFTIKSVASSIHEPIRADMAYSTDRITQAIDLHNATEWAAQFDDVEVQPDGTLRVIGEEEPETDYNIGTTPTPKKTTKKRKPRARKAKKEKKEKELPNAQDLIKDIEKELFGKDK